MFGVSSYFMFADKIQKDATVSSVTVTHYAKQVDSSPEVSIQSYEIVIFFMIKLFF